MSNLNVYRQKQQNQNRTQASSKAVKRALKLRNHSGQNGCQETRLDFLKFAMLVLCLCFSSVLRAGVDSAEKFEGYLQNTERFSANFEQKIIDEDGELVQKSSGTVSLSRPYKMRWETTAPFSYLLVTDGSTLWRYDADLEQLNKEPFTDEMRQTPAMLLGSGGADIGLNFNVSMQTLDDSVQFTLIPKQESAFSQMIVGFDQQGTLQSMQMSDALGQTTHLVLRDVQLNPALKANEFMIDESKYALDAW